MTTNLLSVIEQLVDALKNAEGHKLGCKVHAFGDHCTCGFDAQIEAALAAGKQALEQTQGEETLAKYARHLDGCLWNTPLATGRGNWHCTCGLDSLVLDGELITHPQATEPAPSTAGEAALGRATALNEMSLAQIQVLRDVSDEYNAWIRFHSSGGDYDDFLKQYGAFQ